MHRLRSVHFLSPNDFVLHIMYYNSPANGLNSKRRDCHEQMQKSPCLLPYSTNALLFLPG